MFSVLILYLLCVKELIHIIFTSMDLDFFIVQFTVVSNLHYRLMLSFVHLVIDQSFILHGQGIMSVPTTPIVSFIKYVIANEIESFSMKLPCKTS